jgi:hypothetical protein
MTIDINNLGLDDTSTEPISEDIMPLYVDIAYKEGGWWNTVQLTRKDVKRILNGNNVLDDMPIHAICIATFEGTDCDLRYVYYFSTKTWEIV